MRPNGAVGLLAATAAAAMWSAGWAQDAPGAASAPPPVRRAVESAALDLGKRGATDEAAVCVDVLAALGHPPVEVEKLRARLAAAAKAPRDARAAAGGRAAVEKAVAALAAHLATCTGASRATLARQILRLDGQHDAANDALGRVRTDGAWGPPDAGARAARRTEIRRILQAARRLEVPIAQAPGNHPILQALTDAPAVIYTAAGIRVISGLPEAKVTRVIREALRATAVARWTLTGELAVPPDRFTLVLVDGPEMYQRSLDAARRAGTMDDETYAVVRRTGSWFTAENVGVANLLTESDMESGIMLWVLATSAVASAQPCLTAGIENWVSFAYLGCPRPGLSWVETAGAPGSPGHGGGTTARPADPVADAERTRMIHLAQAGIAGCRAWMAWLARRGEDPPWVQAMVERTEKIAGNDLLKTTLVVEYLLEQGTLAAILEATRPATANREARVRAFELALHEPLGAFEVRWRRWLLPELDAGVRQRLDPATATSEAPADARAALAALEAIRKRALAGLHPANYHAVALEPELSAGCLAHARYLARHPAQAAAWPDAHEEYPDREGFSPDGARAGGAGVIAPGSTSAEGAIEAWMGTFYHRVPLTEPGLLRIGWGLEKGFAVLDCGSIVGPTPEAGLRVAWPADGQTGVPLRFRPELPNPVPGQDQAAWGYPVTLQVVANVEGVAPVVTEMKLRRGSSTGALVESWFSSPERPTNPLCVPRNAYALMPKAALAAETLYWVVARFDTGPDKTWSFKTGR